ncbi:MAG TPA: NAD(P)/FAD-dependent oxidoreductase [Dermatophilaceae bacterium]|jgi:NADH dehydrogenase|nr:NAD(P)/FAD-dependent oxidoreductase [Dermatophilaceae bacterium]
MDTPEAQSRPRVVVVGAGMAGIAAVRALRRAAVEVRVIDAHNYSTFPPLLFQVATCFISPDEVARPVRGMLRNTRVARFQVGRVADVDWGAGRVVLDDGSSVPFDYLVLAAGVVPSFGGIPGAVENAIPLKSVSDAIRLRNRLLRSFEQAAAHPENANVGQTSLVVVGGGASGVELSGYVASFLFHRQFEADYPQLEPAKMQATLVERGDCLLPGFHPSLGRYALQTLRERGVEVLLNTEVREVERDGVVVSGDRRLPAATVVWAGGVDSPLWVKHLGAASREGRLVVDPDLRLPSHPNTFVVGDLAAVPRKRGGLHPQVAQVAIQTGRHAGRQIANLVEGKHVREFAYFDKGMMAIVGRNAAIVQTGPVRLTGPIAWVAWGFLHIGYLPGVLNRMTTGLKYLWWHLSHENANRALVEEEATAAGGPAREGGTAVRQAGPHG